ncbi:MAG: LD-carboxypeptidase [Desulfobacteraceae bacterium]|nr:LD-carboxypeptidase [Desulfobacteraceae bacterium]
MDIIHNKILIPERLVPGDTIGIAAPASPFETEIFQQGVTILGSMGFHIHIPDGLFEKKGYLAGSDEHRADLLNRLFLDRKVKAIVCAKGGFGSIRLLSLLDFESIRKHPKIFVGFSDITAILSALYTKCRLVTFHGPLITTLGHADEKTKDAMFSTLCSDSELVITPEYGTAIKPGTGSGIVTGGNLSTLCHLLGTPFSPCFKEHILFLEDRGEPSYKIDRMLTQMKLAGCFDRLAGLVLGSFEECGMIDEILRIVSNIFKHADFPILAGFDAGHGRQNIIIPMGLEATLDADNNILRYGTS